MRCYDAIGRARMLVDASGTVTDTYHLDAWGSQLASTGSTVNPYRYGGAWGYITDPSGMLQLGARFYWPEVGRFVSQDAMGDGINWYQYASDAPLVTTDPSGYSWGSVMASALDSRIAMACAAVVGGKWVLKGRFSGGKISDRWRHCMASCEIAKACGTNKAKSAGFAKEVYDLGLGAAGSEDHRRSAWQETDWTDNAAGLKKCPSNDIPDTCENRCRCAGLTPSTPEGPPGPFAR